MAQVPYEIPAEMRDFAEKSVEQARKAFEGFIGAAQKAVTAAEASPFAMPVRVKEVDQAQHKIVEIAKKLADEGSLFLTKSDDEELVY